MSALNTGDSKPVGSPKSSSVALFMAAPSVAKSASVGSSSVSLPYCGSNPHQSLECVKLELG